MAGYSSALKFALQTNSGKFLKHSVQEIQLEIAGRRLIADQYDPPAHKSKQIVILFIHGMAVEGFRDPRQVNVCRSLAGSGYRVISPEFENIANLMIDYHDIDRIEQLIEHICGQKDLCPQGRVGLFVPSFSATLGLIAAARPSIAPLVSSICAIGACGELESGLEFLIGREDSDPYGRLIIFKNFLHLSIGQNKELMKAIDVAAFDEGVGGTEPKLPAHLETMPAEERDTFLRLANDVDFRLMHLGRMLAKGEEIGRKLSVVPQLTHMQAAVCFIHGATDDILPASESVRMFERLQELGKAPANLIVTPLLTHGDTKVSYRLLSDVVKLMRSFAFFFGHLGG